MTTGEVENCLKDATEIHFLSNRSILLFFSLEYEAERAYEAVKEFFADKTIALVLTMAGAELWLLVVDSDNRSVEIQGLLYDKSNLSDNLLYADKAYNIDLFMVHGHHLGESALPAPGIASFLNQRQRGFKIINAGVIA